MKIKKKEGYTLLEILVVVIVITILASIAVPQYHKVIMKADVSDALHNMSMFSEAQNKYRIQKGRYAANLNNLDTPLKGEDDTIITTNFIYSAGDPRDDNYCIYSENRISNYTLAKNYKNNSKVICSGSGCNKINSLIKTGNLTELCED